jgi:hypothetical protein
MRSTQLDRVLFAPPLRGLPPPASLPPSRPGREARPAHLDRRAPLRSTGIDPAGRPRAPITDAHADSLLSERVCGARHSRGHARRHSSSCARNDSSDRSRRAAPPQVSSDTASRPAAGRRVSRPRSSRSPSSPRASSRGRDSCEPQLGPAGRGSRSFRQRPHGPPTRTRRRVLPAGNARTHRPLASAEAAAIPLPWRRQLTRRPFTIDSGAQQAQQRALIRPHTRCPLYSGTSRPWRRDASRCRFDLQPARHAAPTHTLPRRAGRGAGVPGMTPPLHSARRRSCASGATTRRRDASSNRASP